MTDTNLVLGGLTTTGNIFRPEINEDGILATKIIPSTWNIEECTCMDTPTTALVRLATIDDDDVYWPQRLKTVASSSYDIYIGGQR